jgi:general L-amino acid transport system permease protein
VSTARRRSAVVWARHNLVRTPTDAVLTVVAGAIAAYVAYRSARFVLVTGRWGIIRTNLRLLMYGRFPEPHVLRLAVALVVVAAWAGLIAGIVHGRRRRAGTAVHTPPLSRARLVDLAERFWIPSSVVLLLLLITETAGPWVTVGLAVIAAVAGRLTGPSIGQRRLGRAGGVALAAALVAVPVVLYAYVASAAGLGEWGGFMLNLFLAACAIVLCFPLGIVLALGRRSGFPLIRLVSTVYIEVVRGAPLFVLLLFANVALGFFVPPDLVPSTPTRAIVVFTLFTAAYMAEIVRGGLQSVPRGQVEAAKAVGLSPARQTFLVVLPQALRNVIPAQIGQLISLFKDTALAGLAMGLFELLNVTRAIPAQDQFRGLGLIGETLAFGALLFWTVSYTMSRESQRLERRLGVGTR